MQNFFRLISYSLVAGTLVGSLLLLYASGNSLEDITPPIQDTVTNFDSCKEKGYQITNEGPEICTTPSGTRFMNVRADIATSSASVISTPIRKLSKAQTATTSIKSLSPKTYYSWTSFKKPTNDVLKKTLSPLSYSITQEEGTETPFTSKLTDNHEDGIYVDIVSGEPLFSSSDKYESGTGWPSFVRPIQPNAVIYRTDKDLGTTRTEVRSRYANSHLGHVFDDGPQNRGGKRYCMNGAALRFIKKNDMAAEGYGDFIIFIQ